VVCFEKQMSNFFFLKASLIFQHKCKRYRVSPKKYVQSKIIFSIFFKFFYVRLPYLDPIFLASKRSNCLSYREYFENHPTFLPRPFQSGVIAKKQRTWFFWDTLYNMYLFKVFKSISGAVGTRSVYQLV